MSYGKHAPHSAPRSGGTPLEIIAQNATAQINALRSASGSRWLDVEEMRIVQRACRESAAEAMRYSRERLTELLTETLGRGPT